MNLIMKCLFGSNLYGLNTENSDKDYKGIYLPEKRELLLGNYAKQISQSTGDDKSKNTKDDVDVEIFSLPYFIELACKGETVALDMLHADNNIADCVTDWHSNLDDIWDNIKSNRKKFYTRNMKSYVGYARTQANRYGIRGSRMGAVEDVIEYLEKNYTPELRALLKIKDVHDKLPKNQYVFSVSQDTTHNGTLNFYEVCGRKYQDTLTLGQLIVHVHSIYEEYGERAKLAKDNKGLDWKAISHAIRSSYQCLGILKDGDFEYPLPQTEFLLKVKTGQLNFVDEVQPELDGVIEEIEKLCLTSTLPQKVDRGYWDDFLLDVYEEYL